MSHSYPHGAKANTFFLTSERGQPLYRTTAGPEVSFIRGSTDSETTTVVDVSTSLQDVWNFYFIPSG